MRTHRVLSIALIATALTYGATGAIAGTVDVSFSVSGSPGAWLVDFTFQNNLSAPAGLYFIGIKSDGLFSGSPAPFIQAFAPTYNTLAAGGLDITYNKLWLDSPGTALLPGTGMSGFKVTVTSTQTPDSFDWFAMTRGATVTDPFQFGTASVAGFQGVVTGVPEPHTYALLGVGIAVLLLRKRPAGTARASSAA
jgi:PEP-CTERM motif